MAENPMTAVEYSRIKKFAPIFARVNVWIYRLTGGRLMNKFEGCEICLVKMTGARSGKQRWIPVMYVPYKEGAAMVASLGGAPKSPTWYHNLVAHPDIELRFRSSNKKLRARQVYGEEKAAVWPTCVEHYPPYADYQARTDREIPVFICE
jgi:deazaflavin-dependent oxidoreductase (nitroreductase family)